MKTTAGIMTLVLTLLFSPSVQVKGTDLAATNQNSEDTKILETYGWMLAQEKKVAGLDASEMEIKIFTDGFLAGIQDQPAPPDFRKIYPEIERVAKLRRQKAVEAVRRKNRAAANVFFQELKQNTNLIALPNGVECEILKPGDGIPPKIGDTVSVHFIGHLMDGTEFYQMGPMDLVLVTNREVCRSWSSALQKIGPGGAIKLYVPPPLSEADAAGFGVEPDSTIIFDVELLGVKGTSAQDLADARLAPPPAPPALVDTNYSDAQVIEAWGWVAAQETHVAKYGLDRDEMQTLIKGLTSGIKGEAASAEMQEAFPEVEQFVTDRREKARAEAEQKQLAANASFFEQLKQNPKVIRLPDGLCYEILQPGTGPFPKANQRVNVQYTGRLTSGRIFDSSQLGPLDIDLDKVIRGWSEGIEKINRGGKIKLYIPPALAYGGEATSGIPPNSILIFEVELLDIKDQPALDIPPSK
ncbi:MAG TPA: FKBP-type peptidyl-prolyl cis-trans isomerase [Verrucomicrobiae bacterium]